MDEDLRRDIAEIRDNTRRLVELIEELVNRREPRQVPRDEPFTTQADLDYLRDRIAESRASRKG